MPATTQTYRSDKRDNAHMVYGKIPPQAPELEQLVLGAIMLESDKLTDVISILRSPDYFYKSEHQKIYETILLMHEQGSKIDLPLITNKLREYDLLEASGGPLYLTNLTMDVVSSAHVEQHARVIAEKYLQRELIRLSSNVISEAYNETTDVFDLLDKTEGGLMALLQNAIQNEPQHIGVITRKNIKEAAERREQKIVYNGPRIGLTRLAEYLGCWQPKHLVIIGARPSTGKTAFAIQLLLNAATDKENPCACMLFSLEMGVESIGNRIESNVSDVMLRDIKSPAVISDEVFNKYVDSDKKISQMPIYIDETAGLTLTDFRAKAKKYNRKYGVKLFVIDYLQLMEGQGHNRENEIAKISRGLKKVAKELDVTVIALSQLNRLSTRTNDNKPKLSDLRESGAIEQDADVVLLLYRPSEKEEANYPQLKGKLSVDIAKNRDGETKPDRLLHFQKEYQRITDYGPDEQMDFIPNRWMTMDDALKKANGVDYKTRAANDNNDGPF